jgi:hypothetical protein
VPVKDRELHELTESPTGTGMRGELERKHRKPLDDVKSKWDSGCSPAEEGSPGVLDSGGI